MWGSRFSVAPDRLMAEMTASIGFDQRLYAEDIEGSKAHAAMLADAQIVSRADASAIMRGLDEIRAEIEEGRFKFRSELEDIHMNIEQRLTQLIGEAAQRLHTARSRNDQMATDLRLWARKQLLRVDEQLSLYQDALAHKALAHAATVMPGATHMQNAQPVTFGHHLLAYVEMAARDRSRFADALQRMNECPLGASALGGTSFPIDRVQTAELLGFARPCRNSIDAVSDRDFVLEILSASAICAMHLSRLAEEIILWVNPHYNFLHLSDPFMAGASSMPQKRNPDAAEMVRAKTGRIFGALMGMLTIMKGLPLSYQKDMQEDKEPLFDTLATLSISIEVMTRLVIDAAPNAKTMRRAADQGFANASDLTDWLVQTLKLPFRQAHAATGRLVKKAEQRGVPLSKLKLQEFQAENEGITPEIYDVLKAGSSVKRRVSEGGTAPKNVRTQARRWLKILAHPS